MGIVFAVDTDMTKSELAKIAFIGPPSSGKSVWINFIYKAEFTNEYNPTTRPKSIPRPNASARAITEDLKITLKSTLDVGGKSENSENLLAGR